MQKGECAMKQITLNKVGYAYDTEWILEDLNLTIQQGDGCILLSRKEYAVKCGLRFSAAGLREPFTWWNDNWISAI